MINDICFSPGSRRLYDLRGSFYNIWEPNALLRLEDSGEESDITSVANSLPTTTVSEVVEEVRDQITAVAVQFQGQYQALSNETGVVSVLDSLIAASHRRSFGIPRFHYQLAISTGLVMDSI